MMAHPSRWPPSLRRRPALPGSLSQPRPARTCSAEAIIGCWFFVSTGSLVLDSLFLDYIGSLSLVVGSSFDNRYRYFVLIGLNYWFWLLRSYWSSVLIGLSTKWEFIRRGI